MNPNFTEEEAKTPVTFGDLAVAIEEIFNTIAANKEIEDELMSDMLDKVIEPLFERVREIEYRQARDTKFFMRAFCDLNGVSTNTFEEHYMKWCTAFDKLNKKENNHESKTNC